MLSPGNIFVPKHIKLSCSTLSKLDDAISNSLASSTQRGYSSSIRQFLAFCDSECVPQSLRLPADEFILCAFAAQSVRRHSGSTAAKRIAALKAWHASNNVCWNGSKRLAYTLNGVKNLAPDSSFVRQRLPVTTEMLHVLARSLSTSNPLDTAILCCALVAFWGQCRIGELLCNSQSDISSSNVPRRTNITHSSQKGVSSVTIHLPRTKTHRHGDDVVIAHQVGAIDPILALKRHLSVNMTTSSSSLFAYNSPSGVRMLSKSVFISRCNDIWGKHGYKRITGHCFRIGGTTEFLLAGVHPSIVKIMGRWSSDSFLRYWRALERLVPAYASRIRRL